MAGAITTNKDILSKINTLYQEVFSHDGYGDIRIEMRILRRGQKEVIIHCGKQYRYVVDFTSETDNKEARPGINGLQTEAADACA